MQKIVVATRNKHKVTELKELFSKFCKFDLITLDEAGFTDEIIENGNTFEENALIKARTAAAALGLCAIADDSGLAVDALGGEPGIFSARYASSNGKNSQDDENIDKVLSNLKEIPEHEKTARFVCAMAYVEPNGKEICKIGTCEGIISSERRGNNGFGYDPVFFYPPLGKTFGELSEEEKNALSHRAKAIEKLAEELKELQQNKNKKTEVS